MANIMLLMTAITILLATRKTEGAQVPAMFVFGDSLVDPGNNNDLLTVAKANYYPNGIDFAIGTTGRYCNGGTVVDHLGKIPHEHAITALIKLASKFNMNVSVSLRCLWFTFGFTLWIRT